MSVLVLINPKAGIPRDRHRLPEVAEAALPGERVKVVTPVGKEEMVERAAAAVKEGVELVVAAGGDGTVHDVAGALIGTRTALGILPLGSGNGFARALGIGVTPKQAFTVLREGQDRRLDVGEVNGSPFFCVSGIGFDALVGEEFTRSRVRGLLPYLSIAARESLQYKPVEVSLRFDEREVVAKVFLVTVANTSQFGSGAKIAPEADPTDGMLDVVVVRNISALELLFHSPRLFDGSIDSLSRVEIYRCRSVRIVRSRRGPLHVDGEPLAAGPILDYQIRPASLRVRLPRSFG